MTPSFGGISLLINLCVIALGSAVRSTRRLMGRDTRPKKVPAQRARPVLSLIIIAFVATTSIATYGFILERAMNDSRSNLVRAQGWLTTCTPIPYSPQQRTVILRLDDVQAFAYADITLSLLRDAHARNMPVVAGVIPKDIHLDKTITRYLTQQHCRIEIAMHGWDHQPVVQDGHAYGEFAFLNNAEAHARLQQGLQALAPIVKTDIVTFIPPHNQLSAETRLRAAALGLRVISSEGSERFDYHSATWNFAEDRFIGAGEAIAMCEQQFAQNVTPCVIMLHPQDFAHENGTRHEERYQEYLSLLEYLAQEEISVTTFRQYIEANTRLY